MDSIYFVEKAWLLSTDGKIVLEGLLHFERQDRNISELPTQDSCKDLRN